MSYESHEIGTAQELMLLRTLAKSVGDLLKSDPEFSLRKLSDQYDMLMKFYHKQPDYIKDNE